MAADTSEVQAGEYVTATIAGQLFGLPISRVQDVFIPERITKVPLAPQDIAGILNLRGRIVTMVDLRAKFGLEKRSGGRPPLAIGIDARGESYGLLIDEIGEVLSLPAQDLCPNPVNLDEKLARWTAGVHRLESQILVLLDIDRVLKASATAPLQ